MSDEGQVRQALFGRRAEVLLECVDGAWKQYVEAGKSRRPTPRANVIWDDLLNLLDEKFAALPGVKAYDPRPGIMRIYVCDDWLALRPKQHDSAWTTRNYKTQQQSRFDQTGVLDGMEHFYHVKFGYVLDEFAAGILHYPVTHPIDPWSFDLRDLREDGTGTVEPISPPLPLQLPPLPGIASKKREEIGGDE